MWSIVICLLIQQFYPTEQLKTLQVTLASSIELPCSTVNHTNESSNPAKVSVLRNGNY